MIDDFCTKLMRLARRFGLARMGKCVAYVNASVLCDGMEWVCKFERFESFMR